MKKWVSFFIGMALLLFVSSADATVVELKGCGSNAGDQLALGWNIVATNTLTVIPGNLSVLSAAGGMDFSVALLENRTVMSWGNNTYGQLGVGDFSYREEPTLIPDLSGVEMVACGRYHVVCLLTNGSVKSWGYNAYGQLGLGYSGTNVASPATVPGIGSATAVDCGYYNSVALMASGTVLGWGFTPNGELGLGTNMQARSPLQIPSVSNVVSVSVGESHTLFALDDGSVKGCGLNGYGQLGQGTWTSSRTAIPIDVTGAVAVCAGKRHSLALLTNGTLKGWGANAHGQLGIGNYYDQNTVQSVLVLTNVVSLAAGDRQTLARLTDNSVNAWGDNSQGQLGLGSDVELVNMPTNQMRYATPVRSIACGMMHSLVARTVQVDFVVADIELNHEVIVWGDEEASTRNGNNDRYDRADRLTTVSPVSYADNPVYKDTVFSATVTVSNRGCLAADAGTLTVWANMATPVACNTSGDFSQTVGTLPGGTSTQIVFSGLDVGTNVCTRIFRAFVDSTCMTTEDYDNNNQSTISYQVIDPVAQQFAAQAHTNRIVLLWNAPFYTGVSNNTVMIRWSTGTYPTGTEDGTLLYSGTNTTYTHSGVSSEQTYYYRLWVSQNGVDWIDPLSGTNQATGYPHLIAAQVILRCSETFTSGSKTKTDCRILAFDDDCSGTINTSALPAVFNLATKWTIEGCGDFNPDMVGDEVVIRDASGTLYLLYFDYAGNLYWNSIDTNDVCWTSYTVGSSYSTNASDWSVDGVGDINGDGMDELILRATSTFEEGGKTKSYIRTLFFDDNGTGTLEETQPEPFKLATRWTIEGIGRFNTTAVNSSSDSEQILLQHQTDGGFYLLYLNDDGTLYWNAGDTNDVCWTSWTPGEAYSTNASNWRVDAIGDVNGDQQDEILITSTETFEQAGKTKSNRRVLFFMDNGTGQLRSQQPAAFSFANLWSIEGMGNFNPTNVNSSSRSEQLLLRQTNSATFYLLYFDDNGSLAWDAGDTNSIYWTSYTVGSAYATNATAWSLQGIGDVMGGRD